jgi:peptidyl-tRNA hydrolase, PTH2 family
MVIVIRRDLKLPKGKLAVQAAHAAVSLTMKTRSTPAFKEWLALGQKKIAVWADDESHLLAIRRAAEDRGLATVLIKDAGRTVLAAGTTTCIGIGPAGEDALEAITGNLTLV